MATKQAILQKFFVYDPSVRAGHELGGLRVIKDEKDEGVHVLALPHMVQWWMDQGLLGREPVSKLSGPGKKLLAQLTRGRSESDDEPKRLPKYSKQSQSGAPSFALSSSPAAAARMQRQKERQKDRKKGDKAPKKPEAKPATPA